VRHGESVANVFDRKRAVPEGDVDRLSERGWEQARGLGRRLEGEGIEAIVASPMRRAEETAEGINEVLALPLSTDDELFEVRQSDAFYDNLPDAAEHATLAWMPTAPPDEAPAGAESFAEILGRVRRARVRLEAAGAERLLVVSIDGIPFPGWALTTWNDRAHL
jgi:broad specificity phosphatase PhoE